MFFERMRRVATCGITFALMTAAVSANPSSPNYIEDGDAGSLPADAQSLVGVGPIQVIAGNTGPGDSEDMYRIHIFDPDAFTASTSLAVLGGSATFDTQLWLFDANGLGIAANDECPFGGAPGSCLSNLGPGGAGLLLAPGDYFLAISGFDNDPQSLGGLIFNPIARTDIAAPDGPGAGSPIESWNPPGDTGSYQIQLIGAEYIIPPSPYEPGTMSPPFALLDVLHKTDKTSGDDQYCTVFVPPTNLPALPGYTEASSYGFNGEFYAEQVDLRVCGRGVDLVWGRKYRSQLGPNTAMGNRWDYSYNIYLEPCAQHIILHDGHSREDLYQLQPDGTWTRAEFFGVISQNPDLSFSYTYPDANNMFFHAFDGSPQAGKISAVVDRYGNAITFDYDPGTGRLTTIHDTLDAPGNPRQYSIGYNADGFISSITDYTGRQVTYEYYADGEVGGSAGDLKSVTTPPVVGTPNGNDFPLGKITTYTYTTGFADERLNHDLLSITDPKGQTYLQNEFAHTVDPNDPRYTISDADVHFDRLVRQNYEGIDTIVDFTYVPQVPGPGNNGAIIEAIVNDGEGHVKELSYDDGNRLVVAQEYTGIADPNQPTDDTTNRPGPPLRPGDPVLYESRFEYNEDSLPTLVTHPNLDQDVFIYDEANPNRRSQGNLLETQHLPGPLGGDQPVIVEQFEYAVGFGGMEFVTRHVDGRGNETLHEYDAVGNRTRTTERIPSVIEDFEYNAFGQITARVLPDNGSGSRRRDEFTYYAAGPQTGYKQSSIDDVNDFALTTTYEYDSVGNVTRTIDPRGNDTIYTRNALNEVVREQSKETSPGSGIRYEKLTFYDANDNIIRIDVENKDDQGVLQPNTHLTTIYEYDSLNYVTRRCQEVGSVDVGPGDLTCGALPQSESVVQEYEYDNNYNLTLARAGEATDGDQPANTVTKLYDERDLVFQSIRAQGDADQSTTQFDYDGNKNVVTLRGGLEDIPLVTTYEYDGFNRLTRMVDPMSNEATMHYDANSNRLTLREDGELNDAPGGGLNIRLFETEYAYDNMNRLTRTTSEFFDPATQAPVGDGQSTHDLTYSDNSQVILKSDDNGNQTTYAYDTMNRLTLVTDAKNNTAAFDYDANSNVVTKSETDKSDLLNPDQGFTTTYEYDNLDRLTRSVDNRGNAVMRGYDSRDNQTLNDDALGNETRYAYDGMNRLTRTTRDLDGDGADGDGNDIVIIKIWDDSSRLTDETDDLGHTTTYEYDSLNRLTRSTYADGTDRTSTYDAHDNRTGSTDANGSATTYEYDLLNRLTLATVTPGAGVSSDTTFEQYQYDGLSRLVRAEDDDSIVTRAYDSLSNLTVDTLNGQTTSSTHDGNGNRLSCTYPGGRVLTYAYDALDRITSISDGGPGAVATYDYVGRRRLERVEYGNGTRTDFTYDGITGVPNPPGDSGVGRIVDTTHSVISTGSIIDARIYIWDPVGNKKERKDVLAGGPELTHDYEYDSIYRLTRTVVNDSVPMIVGETNYEYDGAGNRLTLSGSNFGGLYSLDPTTPQPADAQVNQYTKTPFDQRAYDENGNLIEIRGPLLPDLDFDDDVDAGDFALLGQCFGGSASPPAPTCPPGVNADFDFDGDVDAGDFVMFTQCFGGSGAPPSPGCSFGGVTETYTYDYRNRLVEVVDVSTGQRHTYAYDALGRRIARVLDADGAATETRYLYFSKFVCEEQDGAGITAATYFSGEDCNANGEDDAIDLYCSGEDCNANGMDDAIDLYSVGRGGMQRGGLNFYYHADDLGNVMAVTDDAGNVVERYEYDDFGRPSVTDGAGAPLPGSAIGNPYLFSGRRYDPETGWYCHGTRYLDPQAGRFMSRDSLGIWGNSANIGNGYTYGANNPWSPVGPGAFVAIVNATPIPVAKKISGSVGKGGKALPPVVPIIEVADNPWSPFLDLITDGYVLGPIPPTCFEWSLSPGGAGPVPVPDDQPENLSLGGNGYRLLPAEQQPEKIHLGGPSWDVLPDDQPENLNLGGTGYGRNPFVPGTWGACPLVGIGTGVGFRSQYRQTDFNFVTRLMEEEGIYYSGHVKVQFHWDRNGKKDANSSCWIRAAGTGCGFADRPGFPTRFPVGIGGRRH